MNNAFSRFEIGNWQLWMWFSSYTYSLRIFHYQIGIGIDFVWKKKEKRSQWVLNMKKLKTRMERHFTRCAHKVRAQQKQSHYTPKHSTAFPNAFAAMNEAKRRIKDNSILGYSHHHHHHHPQSSSVCHIYPWPSPYYVVLFVPLRSP